MKSYSTVLISLYILAAATISAVHAQDMSAFELINNLSVGLTPAPSSKWGAAIADIDRNGYPDLFQIRSASPGYSRIYINNKGVFTEITAQSPLRQIEENTNETQTKTVAWVDFDNDGDKDLYMGTDKNIHFLRNDNNTFVDIANSIGLKGGVPGFVAEYEYANGAWGDFDKDGDLDVLIAQHNNTKPYIFRNDGGTFTNVQPTMGLTIDNGINSYGVQWIDYDLDGDLDLSARAWLYRNDSGVFSEISASIGLTPSPAQNTAWFDYDNDGDLDFFHSVSSPTGQESNELWENQDGHFVNVSTKVFAIPMRAKYRGFSVGDFDNDGDQDIFLNINDQTLDQLLLNEEVEPGNRTFVNVAEYVGITIIEDRKCGSFFDYDRDGFLDLYLPSAQLNHILYHNITNENNWVGFILEGTQSNRDAVGTLVKLYAGGKSQIRFTQIPTDYQNQDNPWVHFGLGQTAEVDSVVIRWPLGLKEVLRNVAINQYHEIKEGQTSAVTTFDEDLHLPEGWRLEQNHPNPFNPSTQITYHLPHRSVVTLKIFDLSGREVITLMDQEQIAGTHETFWDGRDQNGYAATSGVYFYRIRASDFDQTKKMILVR